MREMATTGTLATTGTSTLWLWTHGRYARGIYIFFSTHGCTYTRPRFDRKHDLSTVQLSGENRCIMDVKNIADTPEELFVVASILCAQRSNSRLRSLRLSHHRCCSDDLLFYSRDFFYTDASVSHIYIYLYTRILFRLRR